MNESRAGGAGDVRTTTQERLHWLTHTRAARLAASLPRPQESDYSSPLHRPAVAARVGIWLATCLTVCMLTGLLSHTLQHPPSWWAFWTGPPWIYRVTQGAHITTGIIAIPLLLIKLWVVSPRFWVWPPVKSPVHAIERLSVFLLVGSAFFQLISGLFNVAEFYPWTFFFPPVHYAVSYVTIGSIALHIAIKLPVIREALGESPAQAAKVDHDVTIGAPEESPDPVALFRGLLGPPQARRSAAASNGPAFDAPLVHPGEPLDGAGAEGGAAAEAAEAQIDPAAPSAASPPVSIPNRLQPKGRSPDKPAVRITRRRLLGATAASAGLVTLATVGDKIPALSQVSVLAQRTGVGPQGLPINRTARAAGVTATARDADWRLTVVGDSLSTALDLTDLQALPQYTAELPIACVEGWSRSAGWTGVRLVDLLELVAGTGRAARFVSLENGTYGVSTVTASQSADPSTLVALQLNGEPLSLDHGFPARLIAPNRPGALQTKWLSRIEVI